MTSTERSTTAKVGIALLWIITVLEVPMMGLAGWSKFSGGWVGMFEGWGYPGWFSYVIGAGEFALPFVLLFPRFASYAASGLIVIMLGALGTVLMHSGERMGPEPPLIHIVVLAIILAARWKVRWIPGGDTRA